MHDFTFRGLFLLIYVQQSTDVFKVPVYNSDQMVPHHLEQLLNFTHVIAVLNQIELNVKALV